MRSVPEMHYTRTPVSSQEGVRGFLAGIVRLSVLVPVEPAALVPCAAVVARAHRLFLDMQVVR